MSEPAHNIPNPAEPNRQQFGLPVLFYFTAVYAAGLVIGSWTIVFTTLILFFWWLQSRYRSCGAVLALLTTLLAIFAVLLASLLPNPGVTARWSNSLSNVRLLTLGILNYEGDEGHLVTAQSGDADGKPQCSWRVKILPYLNESNLHARYKFDEPWDSPGNIKLLDEMPDCFACPVNYETTGQTAYKLVVDRGTAFEPGRSITFKDITDGSSNTICVLEDAKNPVPWTKPEDLTIEEAIAILASPDTDRVSHVSDGLVSTTYVGSGLSMIDGSTFFLHPSADPEQVRDLCLCADGSGTSPNEVGSRKSITVQHPERYLPLLIYILLLLLPGMILLGRQQKNAEHPIDVRL